MASIPQLLNLDTADKPTSSKGKEPARGSDVEFRLAIYYHHRNREVFATIGHPIEDENMRQSCLNMTDFEIEPSHSLSVELKRARKISTGTSARLEKHDSAQNKWVDLDYLLRGSFSDGVMCFAPNQLGHTDIVARGTLIVDHDFGQASDLIIGGGGKGAAGSVAYPTQPEAKP